MNLRNRLRRHPRHPTGGRVRLSWTPPGGLTQYSLCSAIDISESGLRIKSTEALPVGQYVFVEFGSLQGNASVRSCSRTGVKCEIGLEFSSGVRWKIPDVAA